MLYSEREEETGVGHCNISSLQGNTESRQEGGKHNRLTETKKTINHHSG
jgi:hypothetical protein